MSGPRGQIKKDGACPVSTGDFWLGLLFGGALLFGVVAAARADLQLAVSACTGFDFHGAIAALALRTRWLVSDDVLIADVMRDAAADLIHFARVFREVVDAAGLECELRERALRTLGFVVVAKDADGVHDGAVLILQGADGTLERLAARIIFAVGHDDEDFLILRAVLDEVIGGGDDSVVERGAAT